MCVLSFIVESFECWDASIIAASATVSIAAIQMDNVRVKLEPGPFIVASMAVWFWFTLIIPIHIFSSTLFAKNCDLPDNWGMKLGKIIFGAIVAIVISLIIIYKPAHAPMAEMPDVPAPGGIGDGEYCFVRDQKATSDAPYAVSEKIILDLAGMSASGTKSGTQSGPDMTNGYTGTLSGTRNGPALDLIYSYTVEGSENKEKEIYLLGGENLVKHRYSLHEESGVLVPDMSSERQDIFYASTPCAS